MQSRVRTRQGALSQPRHGAEAAHGWRSNCHILPEENSKDSPMTQAVAISAASCSDTLADRIAARTARVGIVGLGYVALPLAVEYAKAGFSLTGIDWIESKVARIHAGDSY